MIKITIDRETDKKYIPFFKINNRFEILLPNPENERIMDSYSSLIDNITEEGMAFAMPMSKGFPIMLTPNETFIGRMPLAEASYEFTCVYFDKTMDPRPLWMVSMPYNIARTQQREFVRYDISIPITVEILYQKDKKDQEDQKDVGKLFFLKTKDVSAGGFKIISKIPFAPGTLVSLTFVIPLYGEIMTSARVIRVEKPHKDLSVFWIAFQFVDIIPKERDAIVQFIFRKQLEERRKFSESNKK